VSYARDLWAAGVYHPKSSEYNLVSARADFTARRFVFRMDGFAGAPMTFWDNAASLDPPGKFRILPAFAHDGGTPIYWGSTGIQGFSVLKKAPEARIKELLRVLDYLAAPFGSQEYLLLRYGVRDVHHTLDQQGNPILTPQGRAESTVPFMYLTQPQAALYKPNAPDYADVLYQGEQALYPHLQLNPTDAYYSPTYANRSNALTQTLTDGIGEIVRGRQPLGYLDEVIRTWRAGGGDQSRAEYQAAIAAAA
jgi:putative aldouronate transport system substrate-binding protein